jgi:hypothetical protein
MRKLIESTLVLLDDATARSSSPTYPANSAARILPDGRERSP